MNEEKEKLHIPYGNSCEKEIMPGFGKKQIRHFIVGIVITAAISILLYIITQAVSTLTIVAVVGVCADYMVTRKDIYSQSIVGVIGNMIAFRDKQQKFEYRYDLSFEKLWKTK